MNPAADSADSRARLYVRFNRRNRIVGLLRVLVPLAGGIFLAYLLAQIVLSRLDEGIEIGPIRLDRDTVSFQNPRYNGVTASGMTYEVQAESATTPIGSSDNIQLTNARLVMSEEGRPGTIGNTAAAVMNLDASEIYIEGPVDISDERGTEARMHNSTLMWDEQRFISDGPVHIDYYNGITIDAGALTYDGETRRWRMERVHMRIPAELNQ